MHLALTVPTFEDKVLQRAVQMVLGPLYEQEFLDCSYGFRPGRSAHEALEALWKQAMEIGGGWIIDLDIRKFFDSMCHVYLREILKRRVCDGMLIRLIGKWLKAGVMEEGQLSYLEEGTPQGGVNTPPTMLQTIRFGAFSRGIRAHLVDYFNFFFVNPNLFNDSSYYLSACHPVSFSQSICYFF